MNIYEVKFWTTIFIDEEKHEIIEGLSDDELKEKIKNPSVHVERSDGKFHIGAYNLGKAFIEANEFLEESMGEGQYDIISIKEKESITIMNWPDDDEECNCLSCRTERAAEEDKLKFDCKGCGKEIVVVDGWDEITCPSCGINILRDRILGSQGNYFMMDIDKLPKKKVIKPKGGKKKDIDVDIV